MTCIELPFPAILRLRASTTDNDDRLDATVKASTLKTGAHDAVSKPLDHFPPLIIHACLAGDLDILVDAVLSHIEGEFAFSSEVISFPRRGFAPRPVEVLSGTTLAAYKAIVSHLSPALPTPSRTQGAWSAHQEFGTGADATAYVVDIDYTACYELIDHGELKNELLLRSFDLKAVADLQRFLASVGRQGRGLPQMLAESDLLADAYLSVIDRDLERRGYTLHRYADDLRVITPDWGAALRVIEETADLARSLGLLLSSAKTAIRRSGRLQEKEEEVREVLMQRLSGPASESLIDWIARFSNPYEDEEIEDEAEDEDEGQAAYWRILEDWHRQFTGRENPEQTTNDTPFGPHLNVALAQVREYTDDIPGDLLSDLVFEDESRMENVVKYLVTRYATMKSDLLRTNLTALLEIERHTVWSKLWLLYGVENLWAGSEPSDLIKNWVRQQLNSDREVLRAQASWTLARLGRLTIEDLQATYLDSSVLSAPALSAAAGLQTSIDEKFGTAAAVRAISEDTAMNKKAFAWALTSTPKN